MSDKTDLLTLYFSPQAQWEAWLDERHAAQAFFNTLKGANHQGPTLPLW